MIRDINNELYLCLSHELCEVMLPFKKVIYHLKSIIFSPREVAYSSYYFDFRKGSKSYPVYRHHTCMSIL